MRLILITSLFFIFPNSIYGQVDFEHLEDSTISFDYVDNSLFMFKKIIDERDSSLIETKLSILFDSKENTSLKKFQKFYLENLHLIDSLEFDSLDQFLELKIPVIIKDIEDSISISFQLINDFWIFRKVDLRNISISSTNDLYFNYLDLEKNFSPLLDSLYSGRYKFLFENSLGINFFKEFSLLEDSRSYFIKMNYKISGITLFIRNKYPNKLTLEYNQDYNTIKEWKLSKISF